MDPLSQKVVARYLSAKDNFKQQKPDQWGASVQYANGERHDWGIKAMGEGKFVLEVKTPKGIFRAKKDFADMKGAERYADKYIEKAHGWDLLEKDLGKDFHKV